MEVYDILVDETGDEIHADGDLKVGECTRQNQKLLLITEKTTLRAHPLTGVGIASWILDERSGADLKAVINTEFEEDGQTIEYIKGTNLSNLSIKAGYGSQG